MAQISMATPISEGNRASGPVWSEDLGFRTIGRRGALSRFPRRRRIGVVDDNMGLESREGCAVLLVGKRMDYIYCAIAYYL